jgi:hypothetical protein
MTNWKDQEIGLGVKRCPIATLEEWQPDPRFQRTHIEPGIRIVKPARGERPPNVRGSAKARVSANPRAPLRRGPDPSV